MTAIWIMISTHLPSFLVFSLFHLTLTVQINLFIFIF